MSKEKIIYDLLASGATVRSVAGVVGVSTKTVLEVRAKYPEKFPPRSKTGPKGYQKKNKKPKILISARVPPETYANVEKARIILRLNKSDFLIRVLSSFFDETPSGFRLSQSECGCPELSDPETDLNECPHCGFYLPF